MIANVEKWVTTGCVDCGEEISHPQPDSSTWTHSFKALFSDINMTIREDKVMKHFYIVLHTMPNERAFLSCRQAFFRILTASEVKKVMTWANSIEELK